MEWAHVHCPHAHIRACITSSRVLKITNSQVSEFTISRIHKFTFFFLFFRGESYGVGHNHWFLFVIVTSFIITLLWCFFYLLQLREAISMNLPFSWLKLVRNFSFLLRTFCS